MANSLKLDFGEARQGKYGYEVKDTMNKYYIRNRAEKFEILLKKKAIKSALLGLIYRKVKKDAESTSYLKQINR